MVNLRPHRLRAKGSELHRVPLALVHKFLVVPIPERLGRANLGAPRLEVLAGTIVTQVALLHQARLHIELRHAEGAGIHTVATAYATRGIGLLHDSVWSNQDRHDWTDLGAGREGILAMHTNRWLGRNAHPPIHEINHNHAFAFVRIAFPAGCLTGTAAYAARGINEQSLDRHLPLLS